MYMISRGELCQTGLTCASICEALNQGMGKGQAGQLNQSAPKTIEKLVVS